MTALDDLQRRFLVARNPEELRETRTVRVETERVIVQAGNKDSSPKMSFTVTPSNEI